MFKIQYRPHNLHADWLTVAGVFETREDAKAEMGLLLKDFPEIPTRIIEEEVKA